MVETTGEARHAADSDTVAARLAGVRTRIAAAAEGRPVALVAVGKSQPPEALVEALAAGQRVFGENRVQEAQRKWPTLKGAYPDIELHLIGPLQSNKVKDALALFDVIETVDRAKLARALAAEMAHSGRRPACYIQVNTGEEPQKAGVLPAEAEAIIALAR
ncbi:MAG: alanine racemase, partial [Dongiaceae bacterium]